ncbi:MAG: aldo/keto reductase [Pseudomonadota bacterium]
MLQKSSKSAKSLFRELDIRLGFGGGDLYDGDEAANSEKLIHTALDAGIRYFDTARLYGNGSGEGVLGRTLPAHRDEIILVSKVGILPWSMRTTERVKRKATQTAARFLPVAQKWAEALPPAREKPHAFQVSEMKRSLECTLKELKTDYLDILLLHEPTAEEAVKPETTAFLEQVRAEGKIRHFGVAGTFDEMQAITNAAPHLCGVTQFPSDGLNNNMATYQKASLPTAGDESAIITHSVIKHALTRISSHFEADPAAAKGWQDATGSAADDKTALVRYLLADALQKNPDGVVVFSTSKPERILDMVKATTMDTAQLEPLHDVFEAISK